MFGIAQSGTQGDKVHLSPALMQPIVSDDVADILADLVVRAPANGIVEIAGPETIRISDAVTEYLRQIGDSREIVVDEKTPYFGALLDDKTLMPSAGVLVGKTAFSQWVKTATPPPAR